MNNDNNYPQSTDHYAKPASNSGPYGVEDAQSIKFLSFSRIGRRTFAMYLVIALAIFFLSLSISDYRIGSFELETLAMLTGFSSITLLPLYAGIRRLRDFNQSGWVILWSLAPLAIVFLILLLLLKSGDAGPNKYGDRERFITQV